MQLRLQSLLVEPRTRTAVGVTLCLVLVLAVLVVASERPDQRVADRRPMPEATAGAAAMASGTTSTGAVAAEPPVSSTTDTSPPPSRPRARVASATTTSALVCRNSTDWRCGPFYWDPAPSGNEPMKVEVTYTPSMPKPGETVRFVITLFDDGRGCGNYPVHFGDGEGHEAVCDPEETLRFGPWTPPERRPERTVDRYDRIYKQAGQYTARFEYQAGTYFRRYWSPYADSGSGSVTVTVSDPSPPSSAPPSSAPPLL